MGVVKVMTLKQLQIYSVRSDSVYFKRDCEGGLSPY